MRQDADRTVLGLSDKERRGIQRSASAEERSKDR